MKIYENEMKNVSQATLAPDISSELASNTTIIYSNKTGFDFFILLLAQAGNGQINLTLNNNQVVYRWEQWLMKDKRSQAGWAGNNADIYINDTLYDRVLGGAGSRAGVVGWQERYYWNQKRDSCGKVTYEAWDYYDSWAIYNYKIARVGQRKVMPIIFKKDMKIKVVFTSQGARHSDKKAHGYAQIIPFHFRDSRVLETYKEPKFNVANVESYKAAQEEKKSAENEDAAVESGVEETPGGGS